MAPVATREGEDAVSGGVLAPNLSPEVEPIGGRQDRGRGDNCFHDVFSIIAWLEVRCSV
jgi:hypothetical protein